MCVVHVADLEPRAFAGQSAGAQGAYAAFVRELGKRIRLVEELGKLGRSEKRLDHGGHRAGVDQVLWRHVLVVAKAQAFPDGAHHARKTHGELRGQQLSDGTHAAEGISREKRQRHDPRQEGEAERRAADEVVERGHKIVFCQDIDAFFRFHVEAGVDSVPAHVAEVVSFFVEEQPLDQVARGFHIGRITGPHGCV